MWVLEVLEVLEVVEVEVHHSGTYNTMVTGLLIPARAG